MTAEFKNRQLSLEDAFCGSLLLEVQTVRVMLTDFGEAACGQQMSSAVKLGYVAISYVNVASE